MNFHNLNNLVARRAASIFSADAQGQLLLAWFPPDAETLPTSRAGYTTRVQHITQGIDTTTTTDLLGNLTQTQDRIIIHLLHDLHLDSGGLPYLPTRATTLLLGTAQDTALPYSVAEIQHLHGRLSLTLQSITLPT